MRTAVGRALAESSGQLERTLQTLAADVAAAAAEDRRLHDSETERRLSEANDTARRRLDAVAGQEAERLQRLTQAIRRLDAARSLVDLLDALTQAAAHEADRIAVLVTSQSRLQGWRLSGFDDSLAARSIDLDADAAGVLGVVMRDSTGVARHLKDTDALPPFIGHEHGRERTAVPIVVDGTVVAVLYADALTNPASPASWPAVLEVLTRHAGRALEALTLQRVAGLSPITAAPSAGLGIPGGTPL